MKIGKRILSVLLAVLMLALTASVAFAVEEEEKEPLYVVYQLPCFDTWDPTSFSIFYQDAPESVKWYCAKSEINYENDNKSGYSGLLSYSNGTYKSKFFNNTSILSEHQRFEGFQKRFESFQSTEYKLWHLDAGDKETNCLFVLAEYNRPFRFEVQEKDNGPLHLFEIKGLKYSSCNTETPGSYDCIYCSRSYAITFPASHVYGEDFLRQASTCTEGYVISRYCARCNAVETENGEPWGHNYDFDNARVVNPTCFTEGYKEVKCTRCEKIQMIDIKPATGNHKDNNKDGYCDTCGTKWPKPAPEPTTQPAAEKDEEKAPKQNIFQRIIEWFKNLFKKLFK